MYTSIVQKAFNQPIALVLIAAILLWTVGLPFGIGRAHAASLTTVKDTITDSRPSVVANHTIDFTTPTGITSGQTITITFPAGFTMSSIAFGDVDLKDDGTDLAFAATASGATWGAAVSGQVLTLTNGTTAVAAGSVMVLQIGTNATFGTAGTPQITNTTAGSYVISLGGTSADAADLRIAIIDAVTVTASVDTSLTFTVAGVASGQAVNGDAVTTSAGATATALPFGTLTPGTAKTLAQTLSVTTNATNGFAVTVIQNQNLVSANGADIDTFKDGASTATPTAWTTPLGTLGTEATYGHYGVTSEDSDLNTDEFGTALYAGNLATARTVFSHTGPADGSTANKGQTRVAVKIQVTALQEAATDYNNRLTYVATPTF